MIFICHHDSKNRNDHKNSFKKQILFDSQEKIFLNNLSSCHQIDYKNHKIVICSAQQMKKSSVKF